MFWSSSFIRLARQVSVILQLTYITKFFHWEMGYMNSMDIQHDRAGFYLCWGCLVRKGEKERKLKRERDSPMIRRERDESVVSRKGARADRHRGRRLA